MALTPDIKTTFDRVNGLVVIEDITDYAAQGVNVNVDTVEGFLKAEVNTGSGWQVFYNNLSGATPDIDPPTNYINTTNINIPLIGSLPLPANYRITYFVDVNAGADQGTEEFEYEYKFKDPEICINDTVDCQCSKITSVDVTNYAVPYATLVSTTRNHTLYPPPTSGISPLSANLVTLVYTPIYTGTWTSEVVATLTYLQDDGLYIEVELAGSREFVVSCDTTLSKIICCLTQIDKTYRNYLCKSQVKAENYAQTVVEPTWHYLTLFLAATTAGNQNKAAEAYQKILDYSGCEDCKCNDSPSLVTGCSGGGGNANVVVVESQDNSIDVTQSVIGGTTTFNIEVSSALQTLINNIGNSVNVVGVAPYITVTSAGSNPKVFTVAYTGPTPHTNQIVEKQIVINPPDPLSLNPNYMTLTVYEIANTGPNVAPTPHSYKLGFTTPNTQADKALIYVADFLDGTASKRFIAQAQLNKRFNDSQVPANPPQPPDSALSTVENVFVQVLHTSVQSSTGNVVLRLVDAQGVPYELSKIALLMAPNKPFVISLTISITA